MESELVESMKVIHESLLLAYLYFLKIDKGLHINFNLKNESMF
ncbi:MAG: hypothetical protein EVA81_05255 [Proteobacteria bacterium]|nr:MAG: hypothetical protein EVA81_05255 [Pseudomonadota bacterium]